MSRTSCACKFQNRSGSGSSRLARDHHRSHQLHADERRVHACATPKIEIDFLPKTEDGIWTVSVLATSLFQVPDRKKNGSTIDVVQAQPERLWNLQAQEVLDICKRKDYPVVQDSQMLVRPTATKWQAFSFRCSE